MLNYCTAIYQCSLIFSLIVILFNIIIFTNTILFAFFQLFISISVNYFLLLNLPYYIDGNIMNGLIEASFSSLFISICFSYFIFIKSCNKFDIRKAGILSIIASAITDGFIMKLFFIINNKLPYIRILDIFTRELSYKILYGFIIYEIFFILKREYNQKII